MDQSSQSSFFIGALIFIVLVLLYNIHYLHEKIDFLEIENDRLENELLGNLVDPT